MIPIVLISANPYTIELCTKILSEEEYPDVRFIACNSMISDSDFLKKVTEKNPEVVIAQGERKNYIASQLPSMTIVEMRITAYDLLNALYSAAKIAKKIILVTSEHITQSIGTIENLLGVTIILCRPGKSLNEEVEQGIYSGAKVIVGGFSVLSSIHIGANIQTIYVSINEVGILEAIQEARRTYTAIMRTVRNQTYLTTLLDHTTSGVLAVDENMEMLYVNSAAKKMLQIPDEQSIQDSVKKICSVLALDSVMTTGEGEQDALFSLRDRSFICDKVPVQIAGKKLGALAIIQDVQRLHQSEASVRRKIADNGLRAEKTFHDIIGDSMVIRKVVQKAKSFSLTDYTVLLTGESGTGKEVFAQSIHNYSRRKSGPFVALNCAAMPATLLESELFGYEKGAFTGASGKGKIGMFELAHGGTLFLDEIGELDLLLQGKLLRALQEKKIMRLGGEQVIPVDVRIIAATNKNLYEAIASGTFRQDLFYRINVLKILLPKLREHKDDIPTIVNYYMSYNKEKINIKINNDAMKELQNYEWPGNIRELINIVERLAAMFSLKKVITKDMVRNLLQEEKMLMEEANITNVNKNNDIDEIQRVLALTKGNYTQAAKILGISRVTLWRKLNA